MSWDKFLDRAHKATMVLLAVGIIPVGLWMWNAHLGALKAVSESKDAQIELLKQSSYSKALQEIEAQQKLYERELARFDERVTEVTSQLQTANEMVVELTKTRDRLDLFLRQLTGQVGPCDWTFACVAVLDIVCSRKGSAVAMAAPYPEGSCSGRCENDERVEVPCHGDLLDEYGLTRADVVSYVLESIGTRQPSPPQHRP